MDAQAFFNRIQSLPNQKALPLESWNPKYCGDIDIKIAYDGVWYYMGTPILRPALVALFASVLWREEDVFFLKTPVEKMRIQVECTPLVVTQFQRDYFENQWFYLFETNVGDPVRASETNPILWHVNARNEPEPRVLIRRNIEARMCRNVFYALIEAEMHNIHEKDTHLRLRSGNSTFEWPLI